MRFNNLSIALPTLHSSLFTKPDALLITIRYKDNEIIETIARGGNRE